VRLHRLGVMVELVAEEQDEVDRDA
jgi:hypothetical protein